MATWEHYRALLKLRKAYPALTEGRILRQEAWDDLSLIRITRELDVTRLTVIFHAAQGSVQLPELAGKTDLITGKAFDGILTGFRALVMKTE